MLSYSVARGAAARNGYNSTQIWPDATAVSGIGEKAMWIPSRRMPPVRARGDLYLFERFDDRGIGDPSSRLARSQQIAKVLMGRPGA